MEKRVWPAERLAIKFISSQTFDVILRNGLQFCFSKNICLAGYYAAADALWLLFSANNLRSNFLVS